MQFKSIICEKSKMRVLLIEKRNKIKNALQKKNLLNEKLLNFLKEKENHSIAGYYAIKSEMNITDSLKFLINDNFEISLPQIIKKNDSLVFKVWKKNTKLLKENFNIYVPQSKKESNPDLIIVPMVAFDKSKKRLGYGGGYYDRTIEKFKKNKAILTVGIAFDEQETESIPTDKYDQNLNMIITPSRIIA